MLSLPLALAAGTAGLVGGVHCLGMCGSLNWLLMQQLRQNQRQVIHFQGRPGASGTGWLTTVWPVQGAWSACSLHVGRIVSYMLIGAIFGALGAASLAWKNDLPITKLWYLLGNLSLLLIALKILGFRLPAWLVHQRPIFSSLVSRMPKFASGKLWLQRWPFFAGMVWGFMPCGLLYSVAPFAIFSGSSWSGALLMLVFAICALPHLIFAPILLRLASTMRILRFVLAGILLAIASMGLYFSDMKSMPEFLCITPV